MAKMSSKQFWLLTAMIMSEQTRYNKIDLCNYEIVLVSICMSKQMHCAFLLAAFICYSLIGQYMNTWCIGRFIKDCLPSVLSQWRHSLFISDIRACLWNDLF